MPTTPSKNTESFTVPSNAFFKMRTMMLYLLLMVPFIINFVSTGQWNPLEIAPGPFALFILLSAAICTIIMIISHRRKKAILHDLLLEIMQHADKYQLAYLAGGSDRFLTMCFYNLLQNDFLRLNSGLYFVHPQIEADTENPASMQFADLEKSKAYHLTDLLRRFDAPLKTVKERYRKLEIEYSKVLVNMVIPTAIVLTAEYWILRLLEADSGVNFFIGATFLVAVVTVPVALNNTFSGSCRSVLDRDEVATQTGLDSVSLDIIFAGSYGLMGIVQDEVLNDFYDQIEKKPEDPASYGGDPFGSFDVGY